MDGDLHLREGVIKEKVSSHLKPPTVGIKDSAQNFQ